MANNISVSITADVADLTAKLAVARADLAVTSKSLKDRAKEMQGIEMTPKLKAELLVLGDAAAKSSNTVKLFQREMKALGPAAENAHTGMAGITREMIVMGREMGRGDFTRMTGSATILAQRMGLLTPAVIGTGAAIAALAAPFIAFAVAADRGVAEVAKFQGSMQATNGYAGVTISQLQEMAEKMAAFGHESIGAAKEQIAAIAASGHFSGETMQLIGQDSAKMAQLTGQTADSFIEKFGKMKEGVTKFALEYEQSYHQLTAAQIEYIQKLEEQGDKEGAEHQLAKDIYEYLGKQAPQNLGYLERAWEGVGHAISSAWDSLKGFGRDSKKDQLAEVDAEIAAMTANRGRRKVTREDNIQHRGARMGGDVDLLAEAYKRRDAIIAAEAAEQRVAKATSDSAITQSEGAAAAAKLHAQFEDSKASGEKLKVKIKEINDELAKAVKANPGNKAMYEQEAAAARLQATKEFTPKTAKGPTASASWEEQLHAQEIATGEFFKDQTADELKFWQSKVGLVARGSKEWLTVQGHIYEAQKTLAHQAYAEQIAADRDNIQAAKNNWADEQKGWDKYLADVEATWKKKSTEYHNANREMEAAQKQHEDQMERIADKASTDALEALKRRLSTAKKERDENERTDETLIRAKGDSTPFDDIAAEVRIGEMKHKNIEREMADLKTLEKATNAKNAADVSDKLSKAHGNTEEEGYKSALAKMLEAKEQFASQEQEINARSRDQQIAAIMAVQQKYHGYIDGMVSSTVSGLDGVISGTKGWESVTGGIYRSMVGTFEQQIEKMASTWIVQHLFMTAAQRAQIAMQTTQHAVGEAAKVGATVAGQAAQVGATAAGTATKSTIVGMGNLKEITSHAAAAAAAAYHAMAGIPVVGPVLGAAAAATTFVAVEAFGALASFDVGTDYVQRDQVAKIHKGERIIPARENQQMTELIQRGASTTSNDNRQNGDMHVHYSPTINGHLPFPDQLNAHEDHIIAIMKNAHRRGALK